MLLDTLIEKGVEVGLDGENLRVVTDADLTEPQVQFLRESKTRLIAELIEREVREMAMRWNYTPEDLRWALAQAAADPEGWRRLTAADREGRLWPGSGRRH